MFDFEDNPASNHALHSIPTAPPPPLPLYELRPLSTGEILDRTFALYRSRFWLYTGLSACASGVSVLGSIGRILYFGSLTSLGSANRAAGAHAAAAAFNPRALLISGIISIFLAILTFAAYSLTQAATTSAVASVYLGHTTSIGQALRRVRGRWYRYMAIAFWQIAAAFWLPFVLLTAAFTLLTLARTRSILGLTVAAGFLFLFSLPSFIYSVIAYIRNCLGIPASVIEGLTARASIRRSKQLVAGRKGRIFLLLLLILALGIVGAGIQMPFALLIQGTHVAHRALNEVLLLTTSFVVNTLLIPVSAISFCLFYFDERVRREGFDIEALLDPTLGGSLGPAPHLESPYATPLPPASAPPTSAEAL